MNPIRTSWMGMLAGPGIALSWTLGMASVGFATSIPVIATSAGSLRLQVRNDLQETRVGWFNLGTTQGSSLLSLFPGAPGTQFTTVRVGASDTIFGDINAGTVLTAPAVSGSTITTAWSPYGSGVVVTEILSLVAYPNGNTANTLCVQYTMSNVGSSSQQIGLRVLLHASMARNGAGALAMAPGGVPISSEAVFNGSGQVPSAVYVLDRYPQPARIAAYFAPSNQAEAPDRVVLAEWDSHCPLSAKIRETIWDYTLCSENIRWPVIALYWNAVGIGPGSTRTCTGYYGIVAGSQLRPPGPSSQFAAKKGSGGPGLARSNAEDGPSDQQLVDARASLMAGRVMDKSHQGPPVVFPNPSTTDATVAFENPKAERVSVRLYSFDGRLVAEQTTGGWSATVRTAALPTGLYFWTARSAKRRIGSGTVAILRGSTSAER